MSKSLLLVDSSTPFVYLGLFYTNDDLKWIKKNEFIFYPRKKHLSTGSNSVLSGDGWLMSLIKKMLTKESIKKNRLLRLRKRTWFIHTA